MLKSENDLNILLNTMQEFQESQSFFFFFFKKENMMGCLYQDEELNKTLFKNVKTLMPSNANSLAHVFSIYIEWWVNITLIQILYRGR